MTKVVIEGTYNTTIGLIIKVKNDRVFKVGDVVSTEQEKYRIKKLMYSPNPDFNGYVGLVVNQIAKIVQEFSIGKYKVLTLDEMKPNKPYDTYRIDGQEYMPVPMYDAANSIAIESSESFIGKNVEFINMHNELDNYGRLTEPMPPDMPGYNFRTIRNYCKENRKQLSDLTYEEIEQFRSTV